MDLNTKLIIKVQFNDEIRKMPIHNEDITYDELIIMMERIFKHKLSAEDEIIIKYKDEDDDLITISDDSDLAFALESSNVLKLTLTVENNSNEDDTPKCNLSSGEIISIRKELQLIRDHTNRLLDRLAHSNGDAIQNAIASGRTSAIEGKDLQETSGKEFDPLSVGNQPQLSSVERSETGSSIISNSRIDENIIKSDQTRLNNQDMKSESNEIHRPSPVNFVGNQTPIGYNNVSQVPVSMGIQNVPGKNVLPNMGGPGMPPNMSQNHPPNMGGPNLPHNMGGQNMPPNMGGPNLPHNMGGQNVPPNMGGQNMPLNMGGPNLPHNMGGQNVPPNIGGQNMPLNMGGPNLPHNMGGQNVPPNIGGQNMPPNMGNTNMPPNMGNTNMPPNMGNTNMPPNMGNTNMPPFSAVSNISKTMETPMQSNPNAPSVFTGNTGPPTIPGLSTQQRNFYPNAMQPPRSSNFQGTCNPNMPGGVQNRPSSANQYFYPPGNNSPQFNPQFNQQLQK